MVIEIRQGYNSIKSEADKISFLNLAESLNEVGLRIEKIVLILEEREEDEIQNA